MICTQCFGEFNVVYMCDQQDGQRCGQCFETIDCGQGLHEEGCETMVIESGTEKEPDPIKYAGGW